jgi:hypothetical protein
MVITPYILRILLKIITLNMTKLIEVLNLSGLSEKQIEKLSAIFKNTLDLKKGDSFYGRRNVEILL